jgi:hypothetical protein
VNAKREALRTRRAQLQERAASERAELAMLLDQCAVPLRAMDRGLSLIRAIRDSALLGFRGVAGLAAFGITPPRGIRGWLVGGRAVWRLLGPLLLDSWLVRHPRGNGGRA